MNKRLSGIKFTNIIIQRVIRKKHTAKFAFGYENQRLLIQTSITGDSLEDCISKTEKFLETKLLESEYCIYDN